MKKLLPLFLLLLFSSCVVNTTRQAKYEGDGKLCSLHQTKMHKALVKTHYGRGCPDRNEKDLYPNAKVLCCRGCVTRPETYALIFYCKKCDNLKPKYVAEIEK
ncbi:MAG: hypothetical protein POELPBGB_00896 [Bacteroidia bacterium]|nr:hypothetical protein [Bacteroidia bacterium]